MRRIVLVAAALVATALVALSGCSTGPAAPGEGGAVPGEGGSATAPGFTGTPGTSASPGGAQPGDPGESSTPVDPPPELTQPVKTLPSGGEVTLTGTVMVSEIEMGCLVLEGYELFGGDPEVLRPGRRVRVTGRIATDLMSTCQLGPILRVTSATPA